MCCSPKKIAIEGESNGGLLVAACLTQRPDLFGAAIPAVGVLDMLRFDRFTIGYAWKTEYGDPAKLDDFQALYRYSPLHNLKAGISYPPTLIMTADHDDRVHPLHSFKFAARLQEVQTGEAPCLLRVELNIGHGAGTPLSKHVEEIADRYAFLAKILGMTFELPMSAAK
jgi:prolyl oligopeptidase